MVVQTPKQIVDTGEIGNASTGDILFDGGKKLNDNFNAVYNTFGDQRLFAGNEGEATQVLHATGYYQKAVSPSEFAVELPLGSQHDIDSTTGPIVVRLKKGKLGEGYVFINSNGTLSQDNPLIIQPNGSFVNLGGDGNLRVTSPHSRVLVWCISDVGGVSRWDYSIESMFGQKYIPLDRTYSLNNTIKEIRISYRDEFHTMKLLLTAATTDDSKVKTSEVMVSADWKNKKVYSTEYAVVRRGNLNEEDEIYDLDFKYDSDGYLIAAARSDNNNLRFAIKVIATQKIGVSV
ncbi:baseplate wedge tail fiber protein connector [Escherichia phage EcS1]|uniref:Baseplate wedge tail fiber connector n=1 Tax=Escherichia phage EcS1 TaxID=2083276 RepID=A0A2Z5ZCM8_9CAUD|nr:baseplate wedge tail fiber protein connector [Escherichia phage EcS1]BBC78224.1 Baseplate wedge tail fiber connector [Escherichia phage EcS1]